MRGACRGEWIAAGSSRAFARMAFARQSSALLGVAGRATIGGRCASARRKRSSDAGLGLSVD